MCLNVEFVMRDKDEGDVVLHVAKEAISTGKSRETNARTTDK